MNFEKNAHQRGGGSHREWGERSESVITQSQKARFRKKGPGVCTTVTLEREG